MPSSRLIITGIAAAAALIHVSSPAQVTTLIWDANPGSAGNQDGSGLWNTDSQNLSWRDGALFSPNLAWPSAPTGLVEARFGTGVTLGDFTVAVDAVTVNDLSFTGPSTYTLVQGSIGFRNPGLGEQNHIRVENGATAIIQSVLDGSSTRGDIVFQGGGTLELRGANVFQANDVLWLQNITAEAYSSQAFGLGVVELNGPAARLVAGVDGLLFENEIRLAGPPASNRVEVDQGMTMTFAGPIKNGPSVGGFTKMGAGTLVLHGENTYGGDTIVDGGTLNVSESGAIDGEVIVEESADLENNGLVFGPLTVLGEVSGSGAFIGEAMISAGGRLRIDGEDSLSFLFGLNLQTGAEIHYKTGASPLELYGDLLLSDQEPIVLTLSGAVYGDMQFIDFSNVTNLDALGPNAFVLGPLPPELEGTTISYNESGYMLHVVPEPATAVMLVFGALLAVRRRRH